MCELAVITILPTFVSSGGLGRLFREAMTLSSSSVNKAVICGLPPAARDGLETFGLAHLTPISSAFPSR
jgi:hypothetical protein